MLPAATCDTDIDGRRLAGEDAESGRDMQSAKARTKAAAAAEIHPVGKRRWPFLLGSAGGRYDVAKVATGYNKCAVGEGV